MWPDRVSNPGPLTYESGALPTALRGPAARVIMKGHVQWKKPCLLPKRFSTPVKLNRRTLAY